MTRHRFVPTSRLIGAAACALLVLGLAGCRQPAEQDPAMSQSLGQLGLRTQAPPEGAVDPVFRSDPPTRPAPVIVRGGQSGPAGSTPDLGLDDAADLQVSFEDANLREVVDTLLGDLLGYTYLFDPRVQGTVSLQSGRMLSRREVLNLLEAVLRMNGAALVRAEDGTWRVLPLAEARPASGGPVTAGADAGGYAISVLPLRFISATTAQQLVEPIYQASGAIVADPGLNVLMIAGTSDERRTIVNAARAFDVDWMRNRSIGLFPLEQAAPAAVVRELQTIFNAGDGGPAAGAISFLPVERLNAILAIAQTPVWLEQVRDWVGRLDLGNANQRSLYVYNLQHGEAVATANILSQLFGGAGGAVEDEAVRPGSDPVTFRTGGSSPGGESDTPGGGVGSAGTSTGGFGQRAGPTGAGSGPGNAGLAGRTLGVGAIARNAGGAVEADGGSQPPGGIRIIADRRNNALVIYALPDEYKLLEQALTRLDVAPRQVLIEATIAEVGLTEDLRFGVQSFFRNNSGDFFGGFTLNEAALSPATFVPGFNAVLARNGDPRGVLSALETVTDVQIISSPQLVVLDNQEAFLVVGDRVPITTRQAQSVIDPDSPVVNTVEFVSTGVILRVTPRINQGGMVTVDVRQEVSSVTGDSGTLTPTISERVIQSNVAVRSGQTVVLGGLISDQQSKGTDGVPVLSRIPVLGALFGEKTRNVQRTELIVFITPRIIRNPLEAQAVTEELVSRIRALRPVVEVPPGS